MKKYVLLILKLFRKYLPRLIAIALIIVLSVGLIAGIGAATKKVSDSANQYYEDYEVSDLDVKSTSLTGFTSEEITKIQNKFGSENIEKTMFYQDSETKIRVHFLDLENNTINRLTLKEGSMPSSSTEILAERKTDCIKERQVGDKVTILGTEYTISGIVINPYYFQLKDEPLDEDENVEGIFYAELNSYYPVNAIYVKTDYREIDSLSKTYKEKMEEYSSWIEENISNVSVLTLSENVSFAMIYELADKVELIGWILMAAFMVVAALVVLTTISRLIDEERPVTATMKTLGYGDFSIINEYLLFTLVATLIGAAIAWPIGYLICNLIYVNFDAYFDMPEMVGNYHNFYFFISSLCMILAGVLTAVYSSLRLIMEKPADLLKPKAPKAGKKILLERIPILWKPLAFRFKCTARNLFRNKKHFFMTVISVTGSTILVFLASGLLSYSMSDSNMGLALRAICVVVLTCALGLTAVIVYVLTNINISERKRELATFMVLGYHDKEVSLHIFREIYIMSVFSVILGTPLGALSLSLVFQLLGFGSMADVGLWVYFETPCLTLLFTFFVTLLLKHKITSIDMNESLKSLE